MRSAHCGLEEFRKKTGKKAESEEEKEQEDGGCETEDT